MNNIDRLLIDLNDLVPLSPGLRNDLPGAMKEKIKKSDFVFLKSGSIALKAWQLVSGFIRMIRTDAKGNETVVRLYFPKQIVTDLESFYDSVPVTCEFVATGDVTVLEIKRVDVFKLRKYTEVDELIQQVSFLDKKIVDTISLMLRMPEKERVKSFLEEYPVEGLPYKYCASLLNMTEEEYEKNKLILEGEGISLAKIINTDEAFGTFPRSVYEINIYLLKNYARPDLGNTEQIAALFGLTSRTLNRLFDKAFGIKVSKFVLKLRMERALELLKEGHLQVGEVAGAVGYKNIAHFSVEFKKYYGHPPKFDKKK